MSQILLTAEFEAEEDQLAALLEKVSGLIQEETDGFDPMLGLEVDGEHRDPEEPLTSLFS